MQGGGRMLHVGHQNYVNKSKILAITRAESAPLQRQRQRTEDLNKLIDCTRGRKAQSLVHLIDGFIVASSIQSESLFDRFVREATK